MRISLWLVTFLALFTLTVAPLPTSANSDTADHFEALRRLSQIIDMVETSYVKPISRKELIDDAIKGMMEQLDPHSTFLSPEDFKDMQVSTSGKFSGIGIEISLENGRLLVVSPIEDTPAYDAGLKAGDLILEIDGESTQDISLMDAVKKIRGPKGSTINLLILHEGEQEPVEIAIVRGTIPIISAKSETIGDGYLYLRLTRFNENTTQVMREKIAEFKKNSELKGIVLDLRNNPGGLLGQAISVVDSFVSDGLIVYVQGQQEADRKDYFAVNEAADVQVPLVVLINPGSASASEIVAGALQDLNRALIVGEKSFGKGSVQNIIPLSDGSAIKLTTALYYTPSGRSIQAKGIEPDISVPFVRPADDEKENSRFIYREKDLSGHLMNGNGAGDKDASFTLSDKAKKMLKDDNQLRIGLELVRKLPKLKTIQ